VTFKTTQSQLHLFSINYVPLKRFT